MNPRNQSFKLSDNLPTRSEYEQFIYTITEKFQVIEKSTLHFFTTGPTAGLLKGTLTFKNSYSLRIVEVIDFASREILDYSYTVFNSNGEKIQWYDPQPHSGNPSLASTFPHHKHEQPDIKNNRKPAENIGFNKNNLATLIDIITDID